MRYEQPPSVAAVRSAGLSRLCLITNVLFTCGEVVPSGFIFRFYPARVFRPFEDHLNPFIFTQSQELPWATF
jgi:hypothetical protein